MSIAPTNPQSPNWHDEIPSLPIWRFTVEEYHEMIDSGILRSGTPIELLEGWLVRKMIKKPPHELSTGCICDILAELVGPEWHVRNQGPITTDDSEPEPDVSVARGSRRDYVDRHPSPSDIAIVIEVADTSLDHDRGQKKRIYATSRILVYWIVNLQDRCVEVYTKPTASAERPEYADQHVYQSGDRISVFLDEVEVGQLAVDDLLP